MNLRQMEVFHAIMRAGSVTGAAVLLNVTQPAVSAVLRHCEDQLRIKLFERSGGRLTPTPEAEALFPDIANIFQRIDTVSRMANDLAGGRLGDITVAATFAITNGPLAQAAAQFTKHHPSVKLSIHALPTHQVVDRVSRREVDFGIGFGPIDDPAVASELVAKAEIACIMPCDHPLAKADTITVDMLKDYPVITYAPQTPIGGPLDAAFQDANVTLIRSVQVNYSMSAFILAAKGAGVALVEPHLLNAASLPSLVLRPFSPAICVETHLIRPVGRQQTRTTAAFIETVKSEIIATYRS